MIYIITLLSYKEYIIYDICFVYLCAIFKEQFLKDSMISQN